MSPRQSTRLFTAARGFFPGGAGVALAAALTLALGAPPARAQTVDEAKRLQMSNAFNAGAQAYKAGQYLAAATAFEQAYAILPSAALLFSAAQAYRRQYLAEPSPATLKRAISLYRDYLRVDPQANRREDAMEALQTLVPLERITVTMPAATGEPGAGIGPTVPVGTATGDGAAPAAQDASSKRTARILISAGAEKGEVSLDGGAFVPSPLVAAVEPGRHRARLRAAGHDEEEITLDAVANEQVQRHVDLRLKPASLDVTGTSGARVSVDGKLVATVPDSTKIALDPGSHVVSVTLRGHEPFTRRVEAGGAQALHIEADLPLTQQRKIAWAGLGVSGLGLAATGILTGLTFARQGEAVSLRDQSAAAPLSVTERDQFNRAVNERNDFGQAAAVAGGVSVLTLAVSLGMFLFDEPEVVVPPDTRGPGKPAPQTTLEVGLGSAGVRVVF
jgi:hypothetical protein